MTEFLGRVFSGLRRNHKLFPAPASFRELLDALRFYDPAANVDVFLDCFNFAGITSQQIHSLSLGHPQNEPGSGGLFSEYMVRKHLNEALSSDAFRANLIVNTLRAFPEKKRILFVHIPKCAGTDLTSHLLNRFSSLSRAIETQKIMYPDLLAVLKVLSTELESRHELAVTGHSTLCWLVDERLIRNGDETFAIIRDPIDLLISHANFMVSTLLDDTSMQIPDIRNWMLSLGVQPLQGPPTSEELRRLGLAYLHHPSLLPPNMLCTYLGRGTADSALATCTATDIELTSIDRYSPWLRQRWGIASDQRLNVSPKILTRSNLDRASLDYLHDQTHEDRRLYAYIEKRLKQTGGLSITGSALA